MRKDPYLILGVSHDATQTQITAAYESLRAIYQNQLFEEGEVGNEAGRKLAELDAAYQECLEEKQNDFTVTTSGSFGDIENLIRAGNIEDAQTMLDNIETRDAKWHYLQAVIYHKRGWNVESKKQLDIAITLDDTNEDYKQARERLNKVLAGANAEESSSQNGSARQQRAGYSRPDKNPQSASTADACCNTCSTLICLDCCCESCGGDLIPCC